MNKYRFLLLLLVISSIACSRRSVSGGNKFPVKQNITVKKGMNLVGQVSDGKNGPLAGVVVSDGYSCVTTDELGIYQMKDNDNARFVFISVPSDCEIPLKDGFPEIYKSLEGRNPAVVSQCDFNLTKAVKKDRFKLLVMADVQIGNTTDLGLLQSDVPKIKNYIQSLVNSAPVYGVSLGDLVWDNMPFFSNYKNEIGKIGLPVFQVIGNHDHNLKVTNDELSSDDFEKSFGPTYYSYNIGECHFVVLDDVYYTGNKDYTAQISQQQLDWLKEDLRFVSKDKLIILALHIPTSRRNAGYKVSNNDALYSVLDGYKVRILSGHTHNNFTTTISENIQENTLGAVCGAFWTGDLCSDGSPKGFAIYEIKGNTITNMYYKGTAHDPSYQLKIYPPGLSVTQAFRNDFIINVFSWHTNWMVNIAENNGPFRTITSSLKEYDRAAYDYMAGSSKPAYRSFAEPENDNDHMFRYTPSDTCNFIRVEVVDVYGNKYYGTMTR